MKLTKIRAAHVFLNLKRDAFSQVPISPVPRHALYPISASLAKEVTPIYSSADMHGSGLLR